MTPHRERVVRGDVSSEHLVQLFDEPESLVASVAAFMVDGWKRGDSMLVVSRPANWALTAPELEARGCPVAETIASGRLVVLDAATTMATFIEDGVPNAQKYDQTVGELVRTLCAQSAAGLTVYGEMVDLLVGQGNFQGAEQLEILWNRLSEHCSFRLLCGYTAAHFADERDADRLRSICSLHDCASAKPSDLLATWLLANRRPRFHLDKQ